MEKEASLEVHPVLEGTLIISVHRHKLVPDCWDEMSVAEANKKLQRDLLSRMPTLVQMSLGHHAKKIQRNQLNIYHKEKGQESLSYEDCPQNWKHFLNKNYMQAVPTFYAGKSYMLFLHLLAFQTLFFWIHHLPSSCTFSMTTSDRETEVTQQCHLWPPDHSQQEQCHSCLWTANFSSPALQLRTSSGISSTFLQPLAQVPVELFLCSLGWDWFHCLLAGYLENGKKAELCIPALSKPNYRPACPRFMEDLGSRPRLVLNDLPVSNHLLSSHCFFLLCFQLTVCQSTEGACCSVAIASCSSVCGTKAVLVLGWENIVGCIGYWQMAISLFLSSQNTFSTRRFSHKVKTCALSNLSLLWPNMSIFPCPPYP